MMNPEVNLPFAAYLLALVAFGAAHVSRSAFWKKAGLALVIAGLLAQTVFLGARWASGGRAPLSNQYETLLVLSWALPALGLALLRRSTRLNLLPWAASASLLALATASLLDPAIQPLMPALRSNWLLYHVASAMLGYAAFALGAVLAVLSLLNRDREKARDLDETQYRALSLGFLLLTAGIFLGAVWANEAWGSYWSWDPKETWSLITWWVYAVALHLWRSRAWRGRRFALANLLGFACVLITYFGVNFLMRSLHSYAL